VREQQQPVKSCSEASQHWEPRDGTHNFSRVSRGRRLTKVHPGDAGGGRAADLAVKAGGATFDDLQDVQLAGEQGVPGGRDLQLGAGGQLLCAGKE